MVGAACLQTTRAEGAAYIMGFDKALLAWKKLL